VWYPLILKMLGRSFDASVNSSSSAHRVVATDAGLRLQKPKKMKKPQFDISAVIRWHAYFHRKDRFATPPVAKAHHFLARLRGSAMRHCTQISGHTASGDARDHRTCLSVCPSVHPSVHRSRRVSVPLLGMFFKLNHVERQV